VSPLQKQRIEQVEMIEKALKKHPLALYPHLEECVPPEVSNISPHVQGGPKELHFYHHMLQPYES